MYGKKRVIPAPALAVAGFLLGVLAVAGLGAPRVTAVEPPAGAQDVSTTAQIQIAFSRPMDPVSATAHLQIEPEQPGRIELRGDRLTFLPEQSWPPGQEVRVTLHAGARSTRRLPILFTRRWTFTVGMPRVIYLSPADAGLVVLGEGRPAEVVPVIGEITDYDVSPGGASLVYSAQGERTSELRLLNVVDGEDSLLYRCPDDMRCQTPAISPDGSMLAFEQHTMVVGAGGKPVAQQPQVWLMPLSEGAEPSPLQSADRQTASPNWGPLGTLSYYDQTLKAVALVDPSHGPPFQTMQLIPNSLGFPWSWAPGGEALVMAEIVFPAQAEGLLPEGEDQEGESDAPPLFYSHLYRIEVASGLTTDISPGGEMLVEDASPVYSPDGAWLAFTRKYLLGERWSPGRQIWLMRPDGSEAQRLTDDEDYNYASLSWSPDVGRLLFLRVNQINPALPADIGWLELSTGEMHLVAQGGYLPQWMP